MAIPSPRATRRPLSGPLLEAVRRARDLADRDFGAPLNLEAMAAESGYSKYHFARGFSAAYGETPRAYLTRRRMERAQDLLRAANLSVTEICFLVGFESLGSFSSCFKQLTGKSPSGYREAVVQAGGPPRIPGCMLMMWTRPHPERKPGEAAEAGPG